MWRLSNRGRRAVGVISIAVVAMLATSIAYLHPNLSVLTAPALPFSTPALVTAPGDFIAFDFVSPSVGWALDGARARAPTANPGQFWIFRTTDGAKHWQRQLTGQSDLSGMSFGSIQFFDQRHGFAVAVASSTDLYRTSDGGANWEPIGLPASGIQELDFADPRHGWLLAAPSFTNPGQTLRLYATEDGGDVWHQLPAPPDDSIAMAFRGLNEGWIGSYSPGQPHVYTTADGGRSWQRHDVPDPRIGPTGAYVRLLPGAGIIAYSTVEGTSYPFEFTSFDGGTSWKHVPRRPDQVVGSDESFEDAFHWWAIDGGILYKSADTGQSWTQASGQIGNGSDWQYYPTVIDSKHAWALVVIGDVTGLTLTSDGGRHWTRAPVPQPA